MLWMQLVKGVVSEGAKSIERDGREYESMRLHTDADKPAIEQGRYIVWIGLCGEVVEGWRMG